MLRLLLLLLAVGVYFAHAEETENDRVMAADEASADSNSVEAPSQTMMKPVPYAQQPEEWYNSPYYPSMSYNQPQPRNMYNYQSYPQPSYDPAASWMPNSQPNMMPNEFSQPQMMPYDQNGATGSNYGSVQDYESSVTTFNADNAPNSRPASQWQPQPQSFMNPWENMAPSYNPRPYYPPQNPYNFNPRPWIAPAPAPSNNWISRPVPEQPATVTNTGDNNRYPVTSWAPGRPNWKRSFTPVSGQNGCFNRCKPRCGNGYAGYGCRPSCRQTCNLRPTCPGTRPQIQGNTMVCPYSQNQNSGWDNIPYNNYNNYNNMGWDAQPLSYGNNWQSQPTIKSQELKKGDTEIVDLNSREELEKKMASEE